MEDFWWVKMVEYDETLAETKKYLEERCNRFAEDKICTWPCSNCGINKKYKELLGISLTEIERAQSRHGWAVNS